MYLAHELLTNIECNGGSRSLAKERLRDEKGSGWPLEVDHDQLWEIIKAEPLTTQEVAEELNINHYTAIQHLK